MHPLRTESAYTAAYDLSVVVPVFNEKEMIVAFHTKLTAVLRNMDITYEIVFIDDGSSDGTDLKIEQLKDPVVCGIKLSRNFGHQMALLAGLNTAQGAYILMMDGDLQHPPQLIPDMWQLAQEGNEIVQTLRKDENTTWFKRITAKIFYKLFNLLTDVKLNFNAADFRIISRRVCSEVIHLDERDLFLRGMFPWLGFTTTTIDYTPAKRYAGTSKYGLRKMLALSLSGLTAFSIVPIRISLFLCFCSLFVATSYSIYAAYISISLKAEVPGWASQLILMSFLFSGVFIVLAILGDYIGRIHFETKKRPHYIIDKIIGQ